MDILVDYNNVEIRQQEQTILRDVNLQIGTGEVVYLLGKVGSGKSSLLKTLYAELPIKNGEGNVLGYNLRKIRRRDIPILRRKIGIVFQDFQLLADRSVFDNLSFVLKATGWKDKKVMKTHIEHVLEQVGMQNKAYRMPHQLSGGEQQRVVIARALLNSPQIILADEPTGNLDPTTGKELMELLYSVRGAGTTLLIATHNHTWTELYPGTKLLFEKEKITQIEN
jgi:cell division transport system ATP-binding protein